ncbi:MAG TPA: TrkA family potassium uptake protein [Mycobacteriales bacterium]|nr:TrkA family potassium uptake protein [Mycobacteriales bacterium]
MHIVILGCGRVGSAIALTLSDRGYSVAIVDQDPVAFRRLSERFTGRTVLGVGFDRDTLVEAGIEQAGAFAAVSSGDNSNIIAARVARETFGVETVVARIYDPRRAEIYERLGIPTVATVRWTADQMVSRLLPAAEREWADPTGEVVMGRLPVHAGWVGRSVEALEKELPVRVVCVSRLGTALIPDHRTVLQDGDLVHVASSREQVDAVTHALATAPVDPS